MELIPHSEFAKLRLHQFDSTIENFEVGEDDSPDFEAENSLWYDQDSVRYVEFLRHHDDPHRVGSVCLNLHCEPPDLVIRILDALHLPLRPCMTFQEITNILGIPIDIGISGAKDFFCGMTDQYLVRCWLDPIEGLRGVDITRKDLVPKDDYAA